MPLEDELEVLKYNKQFLSKFVDLTLYPIKNNQKSDLGQSNNSENAIGLPVKAVSNTEIGLNSNQDKQNDDYLPIHKSKPITIEKVYFGNYEKKVLIFFENNNQDLLPDEELNLLEKSFNKFSLNCSDLGFINLSDNENNFRYFYDLLQPEKVLLLGISMERLQIKKTIRPFETLLVGGVYFYQTPSLQALLPFADKKMAFWLGFKQFMSS